MKDDEKTYQSTLNHCKALDILSLEAEPVRPSRRIKDPQTTNVAAVKHQEHVIFPKGPKRSEATSVPPSDSDYCGKRKSRRPCACHYVGISIFTGYRISGSKVSPYKCNSLRIAPLHSLTRGVINT
jgi:hypothetical protein